MSGAGEDARLPRVTATFLFTDVERHTELWEVDPDAMAVALAGHEAIIREAVASVGGQLVKFEGDAVMAVFNDPSAGVEAARRAQVALAAASWPTVGSLRVRMGLHTGAAYERNGDYFGPVVIRAARLCDAAHGGQIVASAVVATLAPAEWVELGEYALAGLGAPEVVHQLDVPDLPRDFPPLRAATPTHDRLPHPVTSFIGRANELRAIVVELQSHRVVTLTGVGGAGKTRLAIEAARSMLAEFPDGAEFVDLAVVTDESDVCPAVVTALGLQTEATGGAEPPAARILGYLARRRTLVVFDNCEHVIDAVATLIDELVGRCDALRIVATSREPLRVADERIIAVGSLDARRDAVALFRDRAAYRIDDTTVVETICERLDGIPQAIELAAARTTHLTVDDIAARLDDRFRLLAGGRRRVERQQTLQATLDWSYDLLNGDQQALLRRLAVFAGPFSLEAVEGVASDEGFDVLDTLGALVERSMVNHDAGRRSYRLLESVRLYAEHKLFGAGEAATARRRHRDWFLAYVCAFPLEESFFGRDTGEQLLEHLEDLEAAVRWSIDADEWETAAQIVTRLSTPASLGASSAVERWAWELVPRLAAGSDLAFHCGLAVLWGAGPAAATAHPGENREDRTTHRNSRVLKLLAGEAEARSDDISVFARALLSFFLDAFGRALDDEAMIASADTLVQNALDLTSTRPPSTWTGHALVYAAFTALSGNNVERAGALLDRAVDSGSATVIQAAEPMRAFVLHMLGDPAAVDLAARAAQRATAVWTHVIAAGVMALEVAATGDLDAARHHLSALVPELARANRSTKGNLLISAAGVAIIGDDPRRAARWLACAASWGGIFAGPDGVMLYRKFVSQVRDALSSDERRPLRDEGRSLAIDDALQEVVAWH
jgi:predicted ATPase/class 3 adenylate cyclase